MWTASDAILHYIAAAGGKTRFDKFEAAVAVISEYQKKICSPKILAKQLDMLGHIETVWKNKISTLYLCRPSIAVLYNPDKIEAVITGSRVWRVNDFYKTNKKAKHVQIVEQPLEDDKYPLVPDRILISAPEIESLRKFASEYGFEFCGVPAALRLAQAAASILEYFPGGEERDYPLIEGEFFCPSAKGFIKTETPNGFWLARIYNANDKLPDYLISRKPGMVAYVTDLDWARYWILHQLKYNVFVYDPYKKILQVPAWAPLPRLLARALALCEGIPPLYKKSRKDKNWLFTGVAHDIAEIVANKLGQELKTGSLDI